MIYKEILKNPKVTSTIVIDLTKSWNEIEKGFDKDVFYYLSKGKNLVFKEEISSKSQDIPYQKIYSVRDNTSLHSLLSYGVLNLTSDKTALYNESLTFNKGRDFGVGYVLLYNLIKVAKELGYKTFDFGGIFNETSTEEEQQVNVFKSKWGGREDLVHCHPVYTKKKVIHTNIRYYGSLILKHLKIRNS